MYVSSYCNFCSISPGDVHTTSDLTSFSTRDDSLEKVPKNALPSKWKTFKTLFKIIYCKNKKYEISYQKNRAQTYFVDRKSLKFNNLRKFEKPV